MQEEKRILELLAEVLQKQDRTQEAVQSIQQDVRETNTRLDRVEGRLDRLEGELGQVRGLLDRIIESQLIQQQILRALATNQQTTQKTLEVIVDLLDTVTRMQRDQNRRLDRLENPLENPDVAA